MIATRRSFVSRALALCALGGGASFIVACSSGDAAGESGASDPQVCIAHATPPPAELATPVSTFDTDVAPILERSCAFSSCHGSHGVGNHGVFLAAKSTADMTAVKNALIAPSRALPSMPYVTPGDPEKSFLLHKLDGDLCVLEESCVGGSCGKSMPSGNPLLADDARDAIRRWIAQGAK